MKPVLSQPLRLADLPQRKPTQIHLVPDAGQLEALADRLSVDALRKVRLEGRLSPGPGRDWTLEAKLGATVVQPCRVTMEPVTTRIDEPVARRYSADYEPPSAGEAEMGEEDDVVEPLPDMIDPGALLEEALTLAIPAFPRAEGGDPLALTVAPPGAEPLSDETVKPFAGLAALRAKMKGDED